MKKQKKRSRNGEDGNGYQGPKGSRKKTAGPRGRAGFFRPRPDTAAETAERTKPAPGRRRTGGRYGHCNPFGTDRQIGENRKCISEIVSSPKHSTRNRQDRNLLLYNQHDSTLNSLGDSCYDVKRLIRPTPGYRFRSLKVLSF